MNDPAPTSGIKRVKYWGIGLVVVALAIAIVWWRYYPPIFGPQPPAFVLPDHEIYIVNTSGNRILMFAFDEGAQHVSQNPSRSIEGPSTHLYSPVAVAIDDSRNICVVNLGDASHPAALTVYAVDAIDDAAPIREIPLDQLGIPTGIAFVTTPARLAISTISQIPFGANAVTLFDTTVGSDAPTASLGGTTSTIGVMRHININATQSIVIVEPSTNSVKSFLLPRTMNSDFAPTVVIAGDRTQLDGPADVGFDNDGNIYVTNIGPRLRPNDSTPASIAVFAKDTNGNAATIRRIGGPGNTHTGLFAPGGLAVTRFGVLFVSDANQLLVFPPGANGDAAPSQVITNAKLNDPAGGVAYR